MPRDERRGGFRGILPFFLLFSLFGVTFSLGVGAHFGDSAGSSEHHFDPAGWEVTDHVVCNDATMTIDTNLTIRAGGIFELRGCVLRVDSLPYVDRTFTMQDEGFVIRIDEGGELRLVAEPGRPAGIERADPRFGYTIRADGSVTSLGLSDAANEISGLEGAYQGTLALGGFSAGGHTELEHTRFVKNSGPSLFVIAGGTLVGSNLSVEGNGGIAATNAGSVHLRDFHSTSPIGLFASVTEDVRIERCSLNSTMYGIWVVSATLYADDCHILSERTGVQVGGGGIVHVSNSTLGYEQVGGIFRPDDSGAQPTLVLDNVSFAPAPTAGAAVAGSSGSVRIVRSDIPAHKTSSIVLAESEIVAYNNLIGTGNDPPFNLTNPRSIDIHSNNYEPAVEVPVRAQRMLSVTVIDSFEQPVPSARVRVDAHESETDENGLARIVWLMEYDGVDFLSTSDALMVEVEVEPYGLRTQEVPPDASSVVIEIGPTTPTPAPAPLFVLASVVGVAWGFALSRRREPRP